MELLNFELNELSVLLCYICRNEYVGRELDYVGRKQIRRFYLFGNDAKGVKSIRNLRFIREYIQNPRIKGEN